METEKLTAFLLETLKETKQFAIEQAPDYVQQLLHYAAVCSIVQIVLCALALAFLIYFTLKLDDFDLKFINGILTFVCFFFLMFAFLDLYKIKYSPKVFLMEQITKVSK